MESPSYSDVESDDGPCGPGKEMSMTISRADGPHFHNESRPEEQPGPVINH